MKNKTFFSISILFMGLIILFANSCKKDDDPKDPATFTDSRDGNVYKTVKIGNQVWMAENLRYLPKVNGPGTSSGEKPYFYVYGYDGTDVAEAKATENYKTYGVLYNWTAAMANSSSSATNPSGVQGVCPTGWHLPSDAEWTELSDYLGGEELAGGKLKEIGTVHWDSPNTEATNESEFTALPGGYRGDDGVFWYAGEVGNWWSATTYSEDWQMFAWSRQLINNSGSIYINGLNTYKEEGQSVRCIRDR